MLRTASKLCKPLQSLKLIPVNCGSLYANTMSTSASNRYKFSTLNVTSPSEFVKHVEMNRPKKRNAMNTAFWKEIVECFNALAVDEDCRAIVLSGAGKIFTAGLDLQQNEVFTSLMSDIDAGRKAFKTSNLLRGLQECFTVIEKCPKPVIAAVHNACVGGGIDMICACDIRYCSQDAYFIVKEVDLGIAADLGTLQRFQKITGNDSLTRELTYTARNFYSDEAKAVGLVSRVFLNREELVKGAIEVAGEIASKSPVAVQASKQVIVYSRDHTVAEALEYQCIMNSAMLQSEDVMKAAMANMNKQKPTFSKL